MSRSADSSRSWAHARVSTGASVLISLVLAISLFACQPGATDIETLSVEDVASLIRDGVSFVLLDANVEGVRRDAGVIPGALLLSSFRDYDWAELPEDKKSRLVFYCASSMCSAAPTAARRARDHGYANVAVMTAGIHGWVSADQRVDFPHLVPLG